MESSRRDLLNDMAEHKSILKNNQNTYHPRFDFTPKIGIAFPKTGFCFYCLLVNVIFLSWMHQMTRCFCSMQRDYGARRRQVVGRRPWRARRWRRAPRSGGYGAAAPSLTTHLTGGSRRAMAGTSSAASRRRQGYRLRPPRGRTPVQDAACSRLDIRQQIWIIDSGCCVDMVKEKYFIHFSYTKLRSQQILTTKCPVGVD